MAFKREDLDGYDDNFCSWWDEDDVWRLEAFSKRFGHVVMLSLDKATSRLVESPVRTSCPEDTRVIDADKAFDMLSRVR